MSRVAKKPITLPKGVECTVAKDAITVKGPKGTLKMAAIAGVQIAIDKDNVTCADGTAETKFAGTTRALLSNMVGGVDKGFERKLNLVGVGFRAQAQGQKLNLQIGFSHPVVKDMPQGVTVATPTPTEIVVKGANRQVVGQIAAEIRDVRPPEPYKGKGIRYSDERVVIKETKKK